MTTAYQIGHSAGKKLRQKLIEAPINFLAKIAAYFRGFFDGLRGKTEGKMIAQNDKRLRKEINLYGCRFRCLQAIAEITCGKTLTAEQIEDAYNIFSVQPKIMNRNCRTGADEHFIIEHAFKVLGSNQKARQHGSHVLTTNERWSAQSGDFIILHWSTNTSDGHFTLADKNGKEIFDPWDEEISGSLSKKTITRKLYYKVA